MKFYSEKLDKLFDTLEELEEKEAAKDNLEAEMEDRADEVRAAFDEMEEATKKYKALLKAYLEDYKALNFKSNGKTVKARSGFDDFWDVFF